MNRNPVISRALLFELATHGVAPRKRIVCRNKLNELMNIKISSSTTTTTESFIDRYVKIAHIEKHARRFYVSIWIVQCVFVGCDGIFAFELQKQEKTKRNGKPNCSWNEKDHTE